ncbi:MAG: type III-A CRISPR-associated protein Csm2 [bacterium]|nr:type III-A CRISPR-associated protein Csm2 [bacterium]
MNNFNKDTIKEIIVNGRVDILNLYAESLAKDYAPQDEKEKRTKLTTSQIRNILDNVQRMDEGAIEKGEHELLRPKLAYIAGRSDKSNAAIRELREILDFALQQIKNDYKKFENFRNFLEAIVGYHRFYSKVKD